MCAVESSLTIVLLKTVGSVCCCSLTIVLQWAVCAVKCSLTICYTFYINYSSMPGGLEYRMIVSMILSILAEIDLYNIYLPINLPTYPFIHLLIHSSTHPSTHSERQGHGSQKRASDHQPPTQRARGPTEPASQRANTHHQLSINLHHLSSIHLSTHQIQPPHSSIHLPPLAII